MFVVMVSYGMADGKMINSIRESVKTSAFIQQKYWKGNVWMCCDEWWV